VKKITKEDFAFLRFPVPEGSGILRPGSPVIQTWNVPVLPDDDPADAFTARGVVLRQMDNDMAGERWLCWYNDERIQQDVGFAPALDLTDATGRAHLAWWLSGRATGAVRHGRDGGRTVTGVEDLHPLFSMMQGFKPGQPCAFTAQKHRYGGAAIRLDQCGPSDGVGCCHFWCHIDHPVDANPEDARTLPDGSRLVDAIGLSRVAHHVATRG